jgi:hypothetical protein
LQSDYVDLGTAEERRKLKPSLMVINEFLGAYLKLPIWT